MEQSRGKATPMLIFMCGWPLVCPKALEKSAKKHCQQNLYRMPLRSGGWHFRKRLPKAKSCQNGCVFSKEEPQILAAQCAQYMTSNFEGQAATSDTDQRCMDKRKGAYRCPSPAMRLLARRLPIAKGVAKKFTFVYRLGPKRGAICWAQRHREGAFAAKGRAMRLF